MKTSSSPEGALAVLIELGALLQYRHLLEEARASLAILVDERLRLGTRLGAAHDANRLAGFAGDVFLRLRDDTVQPAALRTLAEELLEQANEVLAASYALLVAERDAAPVRQLLPQVPASYRGAKAANAAA